jgi:hypothetical protein
VVVDLTRAAAPPLVGNVFIQDYKEWTTPDLQRQALIGDDHAKAELTRRAPPLLVPMVDQAPRWDPPPPPVQVENPIKTLEDWLGALGPAAYAEKPRPVAPPPAVESKREVGLHSAPDLTVYDDTGLEELCYRYGDQAACSELARRSGLRTDKPVDNRTPNPPPILPPPPDMATETDTTPSNGDGSTTAPDNGTTSTTTWDEFLKRDKEILATVETIANWFVPKDGGTQPPNTAAAKMATEVPWWKQVPIWLWVILAAGGTYLVTKRR